MECVLTVQQPATVYEQHRDPKLGPPAMLAWKAYMDALAAAGVMRGGYWLDPFALTSVHVRDGRRQVKDGPFADSKGLLGGYIVIDVPSLDEALRWAERSPSSLHGCTEVRPVLAMGPNA